MIVEELEKALLVCFECTLNPQLAKINILLESSEIQAVLCQKHALELLTRLQILFKRIQGITPDQDQEVHLYIVTGSRPEFKDELPCVDDILIGAYFDEALAWKTAKEYNERANKPNSKDNLRYYVRSTKLMI